MIIAMLAAFIGGTEMDSEKIAATLNAIMYGDPEPRRILEGQGIKITPCNFYANIPSIAEIEQSYEYAPDVDVNPPYMGNIFKNAESVGLLEQLVGYAQEFDPPQEDDENKPKGYFWKNSQFSHSDGMSYYSLIRHIKPKRIVEIGSGFSTLAAIEAVKKNGSGEIVCIEPYPRPFLENNSNIVLKKLKAQDLTPEDLNAMLADGDILFIDSTHTVKTGSDCLQIYLRLLPLITKKIYVHVHDIFLPFAMPKNWQLEQQIYWTEQYLLMAFLTDNPKAKFIYGSAYHAWKNNALLKRFMHDRARAGGGSFWFTYNY